MTDFKDALGQAILDFIETGEDSNITVHSDLCDDDILPVSYLFRDFEDMPEIEKTALNLCEGSVLEVGAGTGCHSAYLNSQGHSTFSIDTSEGAVKYLKSLNYPAKKTPYLDFKNQSFDTILILMNGLGLAGTLSKMQEFLIHSKSLLKPNGKIIADSSDIRYLYDDDEGGRWIDLNSNYQGEMNFQMSYKDHKTDLFPWIYIDFETLEKEALKAGLKATKIMEDENFHYLTTLEII